MQVIADRWSPRGFDPRVTLTHEDLLPGFEAARWAPSASNTQPWRFIATLRGSEAFETIRTHLTGANPDWTARASALILNITRLRTDDGKAQRWAEYDLGQAVAYFTLQMHANGHFVHQMGGFDPAGLASSFDLSEHERVVSVAAVGHLGSHDHLTEQAQQAEVNPRSRKPLTEVVTLCDDR